MYAEKRRQKRWHDKNLRTQEFHKGTLVLLYTLKKNKQKLKMRGLGPFVINDITVGGAVLFGEPGWPSYGQLHKWKSLCKFIMNH